MKARIQVTSLPEIDKARGRFCLYVSLDAPFENPREVPIASDPYPRLIYQLASVEKQRGSRKTVGCAGAEGSGPAVPMTFKDQPKLRFVRAQ